MHSADWKEVEVFGHQNHGANGQPSIVSPSGDTPSLQVVCDVLMSGRPAVFPTDTVYGLGIAVKYCEGPEQLYALKERDRGKPIAWLVRSPDDLDWYGARVPPAVQAIAQAFWPGPLTLIVRANNQVPQAYQSNQGTLGLRMPDSTMVWSLLDAVDSPLATTSANLSGKGSPREFGEIDADLLQRVPLAICQDGLLSGRASTVLDCSREPFRIVREGAISAKDLAGYGSITC